MFKAVQSVYINNVSIFANLNSKLYYLSQCAVVKSETTDDERKINFNKRILDV